MALVSILAGRLISQFEKEKRKKKNVMPIFEMNIFYTPYRRRGEVIPKLVDCVLNNSITICTTSFELLSFYLTLAFAISACLCITSTLVLLLASIWDRNRISYSETRSRIMFFNYIVSYNTLRAYKCNI